MSRGKLIGVDWGTTNCRAQLIGADGRIVERQEAPCGITQVPRGEFGEVLKVLVGGWLEAEPTAPILLSGMIGSRQGWVEVPYVNVPADAAALAKGLGGAAGLGRPIHIVPGVTGPALAGGHDVMRGEETQVIGALDLLGVDDGVFCLPGTHSKWVVVERGAIARFATFMTGEVFATLKQHSILGRLMEGEAHDAAAFAAGRARARAAGGLLHQLFGVRTAGLFGEIEPGKLAAYLSGLLIGAEMDAALAMPATGPIAIVGAPALARLYAEALTAEGRAATLVDGEAAAARGLWRIARAAGPAGQA